MSRLLSRAAVRPANGPHWRLGNKEPGRTKAQVNGQIAWASVCALGGIRTPNLLIRSS
jgi:hypothetical protein